MSLSERGAAQIKLHSVSLKVQTSSDTHRRSCFTDSGGTSLQKSITEFCHAPEKPNRILLGTDAERSIRENQSETERRDSLGTHTFY